MEYLARGLDKSQQLVVAGWRRHRCGPQAQQQGTEVSLGLQRQPWCEEGMSVAHRLERVHDAASWRLRANECGQLPGSLPTGSLRTEGASRGRAPRWPTTREAGQRRVRLPASLSNFAVVRLTCVRDLYEIFWCSFRCFVATPSMHACARRALAMPHGLGEVLSGTPGVPASCISC